METSDGAVKARAAISFELEGEDAVRFLAYKKKQYLKGNAEAGRKLLFERLEQWEKQQEEAA